MTLPLFGPQRGPTIKLRWYQREACNAVVRDHKLFRAVLLVMATGLGKTACIGALVRHWVNQNGRVLALAHRDELVEQLHAEIERATGMVAYIEQGKLQAPSYARIVVASVQSLSVKRLDRFGDDFFTHIVVDEAHHYVAKTYKRPLDRFPKAKVLGVTATPKRGDKRAMGRIFQHVSYEMNIDRAIGLGYLVPVDGERVQVEEIHLSDVTIVKGDFQKAELDILMLKAVEGIIKETLRIAPHRQGIGFFPGVASAQAACDRMNALKPNSSCIIHGGTDKDERRELVRKYKAHMFQYLFNCNIATEGFDAPSTDLIIGGRPTKSLGLYFQMIGRGTRPVPGVIDRFELAEQWAERRAAIAASDKPDLKILDFVGNSAAHDLSPISVEDMLGGSYTDKERSAAKKIRDEQRQAGEQVSSPEDALQEARERLQSLLNKVQSQVVSTVTKFDPFNAHGVQERPKHEPPKGQPVTDGQRRVLLKAGMTDEEVSRLNKRSASRAIEEVMARRSKGLCTLAHLKRLEQFGIEATEISFDRAQAAMRFLRGANPNMVDVDHLKGMLGI